MRVTEADDLINGKEYTRRLRQHFEQLNPPPLWATEAARGKTKTKRRGVYDSDEGGSSDDNMSVNEEDDISTQPLLQLLRSNSLPTSSNSTSDTRFKVRPEVIEVGRLKDVGAAQPVSFPSPQDLSLTPYPY